MPHDYVEPVELVELIRLCPPATPFYAVDIRVGGSYASLGFKDVLDECISVCRYLFILMSIYLTQIIATDTLI